MANQNILVSCQTCNPCDWIQAELCPGQSGTFPDVYVMKSGIPDAGAVFTLNVRQRNAKGEFTLVRGCYSVAPSGAVILPPRNPDAVYLAGVAGDADCETCLAHSEGGGKVGGGIPLPPSITGDEYVGWQLRKCGDGTLTEWWAVTIKGRAYEAGVTIVRYTGICVYFDASEAPIAVPPGAIPILFAGAASFLNCADCLSGYPLTPCLDQLTVEDRPIYIYASQAPTENPADKDGAPFLFRVGATCYMFDAENPGTPEDIPANALILTALESQFDVCADCTQGVLADVQPCREVTEDIDFDNLWIPRDALPGAGVTFKFDGVCYTVDPSKTQEPKPSAALFSSIKDEFTDCETCLCGEAGNPLGVRANLCPGQGDGGLQQSFWIPTPFTWGDASFFLFDGLCYTIDEGQVPQRIPANSRLISATRNFEDCLDCLENRTPPGDDPPPPDDRPPVGFPPPIPWWPPGDPPIPIKKRPWPPLPPGGPGRQRPAPLVKSNQLKKCSDGVLVEKYVDKKFGLAGKVITLAGDADKICYEVIPVDGDAAANVVAAEKFFTCQHCEASKIWYRLYTCATDVPTADYIWKVEYLNNGGAGRKVYKPAATCVYKSAEQVIVKPASVVAGARYANCADPVCGICYCWRNYSAKWICPGGGWSLFPTSAVVECASSAFKETRWRFDPGVSNALERIYTKWIQEAPCAGHCGETSPGYTGCSGVSPIDPPPPPFSVTCCPVDMSDYPATLAVTLGDSAGCCDPAKSIELTQSGAVYAAIGATCASGAETVAGALSFSQSDAGACLFRLVITNTTLGTVIFEGTRPVTSGIFGAYTKLAGCAVSCLLS